MTIARSVRISTLLAVATAASAAVQAPLFDLTALPAYRAEKPIHGVVRIHDTELSQHLVHLWMDAFVKLHPLVRYSEYTVPAWFSGLGAGTADLALAGRRAYRADLKALEGIWGYPPLEIAVATGGFNLRKGNTPGVVVFVHKDNPVNGLTVDQLDGVFGGARTGGYVGSVWHTEYPYSRGPEENIRTWGQLGLTGEWADKPIHPGGQTIRGNQTTQFSDIVLHGSDQFVEGYRAFANYIGTDGKINSWSLQAQRALAQDKFAMYYVSPASLGPDLKELAIQGYDGGPFVPRTLETIHDRTYPLFGQYYFYVNKPPGQPVDPKAEEFIRFVLSREGQECVQREGRYIPLMADMARASLKKIE